MARKIDQPFIRVHENAPEHPKIMPLSDKAFRVLFETWCWCKRAKTNGHVTAAVWRKRPAKIRAELAAAGLVEDDLTGGVIVHDFDDWQMTTDDIADRKTEVSNQGSRGSHERWHVQAGGFNPDCPHCDADTKRIRIASDDHANAYADAMRSDSRGRGR